MPTPIAFLPRRDGSRLALEPSLGIWRKIEREFGPLGDLFKLHRSGSLRLEFYLRLIFECARRAGEDATFDEVATAVYEHGLNGCFDIVDTLLEDIFRIKPRPSPEPTDVAPEPPSPPTEGDDPKAPGPSPQLRTS